MLVFLRDNNRLNTHLSALPLIRIDLESRKTR